MPRTASRAAGVPAALASMLLVAVLAASPAHADPTSPPPQTTSSPTPSPPPTVPPTQSPQPSQSPSPPPGFTPKKKKSKKQPKPTASPSPTRSAHADGGPQVPAPGGSQMPADPPPLSASEVAAQVAEAKRIRAAFLASGSSLGAAMKEMDRLSAQANALLQSLDEARETERKARAAAAQARAESTVVAARLSRARQVMREWAFNVYTEGDSNVELVSVLDAMLADPSAVGDPMGDLAHLTDERLRSVQEIRQLTVKQASLTRTAEQAERDAAAAAQKIVRDKKALDKLVRLQKTRLEALQKLQAKEIKEAGPVAAFLVGARTPEAQAAAKQLSDALGTPPPAATAYTGGKPCSGNEVPYPNGLLPPSALCPLWKAPGESLRPKAATAFNALSQAYAKQTGTPICVTDSYRSLPEQYAVKATRGGWAAAPGTSKHGLGIALDLCGGINSFGSPAHLWMQQNAPLYGWYHPDWAAAGGSLPEPWHWQFSG